MFSVSSASLYLDMNEERKEVLTDIAPNRSTVDGISMPYDGVYELIKTG